MQYKFFYALCGCIIKRDGERSKDEEEDEGDCMTGFEIEMKNKKCFNEIVQKKKKISHQTIINLQKSMQ